MWDQDAAMGLVLSAATGRGWTTGSGMEGPPVPAVGKDGQSGTENISTFPWSLFTKSPRRRMLIAFTCTICGQRTTRAINPHAYTDGTVFVQVTMLFKEVGMLHYIWPKLSNTKILHVDCVAELLKFGSIIYVVNCHGLLLKTGSVSFKLKYLA